MQRTSRLSPALAAATALGALALHAAPAAAQLTVFMDGLSNPRGLAFEGSVLYVAESGTGGNLLVGQGGDGGQDLFYGTTGRISMRQVGFGGQSVYLEGLPSVAGADGSGAAGPSDVAIDPEGRLYTVIGLGADPSIRLTAPLNTQALGGWLGNVVRQNTDFGVQSVLDVADLEQAFNYAGGPIDSNPFSLAFRPGGDPFNPTFAVTDAGGNSILFADTAGNLLDVVTLPNQPNPLPFGPPEFEPVPTGTAWSNDGETLFVSTLTGFPFPQGEASIFAVTNGVATEFATGLTNLTDLAVAEDGTLYALSFDIDGLLNPGTEGGLYRINADGSADLLLSEGLTAATGLAIGPDGAFYISNFGPSPDMGQVLRYELVPEPASATALLATAGLLLARRRK